MQDTQAALQAAEAALQDSEALRMEYDVMCQQSFEASRKLSALQLERDELERQLSDARARAVAAAEELAEHRELQMQYDHQCQARASCVYGSTAACAHVCACACACVMCRVSWLYVCAAAAVGLTGWRPRLPCCAPRPPSPCRTCTGCA